MSAKTKARLRRAAASLPAPSPSSPAPVAAEEPASGAVPTGPTPLQTDIPRVYRGDRAAARCWTCGIAILGGMILYELLLSLFRLLR